MPTSEWSVQPGTTVDHGRRDAGTSFADGGDLVGILAHELRTPLTTIYAGSAVLAHDADMLPAMRKELAENVSAEAGRLYRAIEDLLVLTALEHDALQVAREPVALVPTVQAAVAQEARRWPGLAVTIQTEGGPGPVAGDPQAVAHVVRNLVADVASRTSDPTRLSIAISSRPNTVAVRFIDRTRTLRSSDLPDLFEVHDQPVGAQTTNPGIRRFVARQLTEAMGGRITAMAEADGATTVTVDLPTSEVD